MYLRCSLELETPGLGDECERGVTGYLEVSALPSLSWHHSPGRQSFCETRVGIKSRTVRRAGRGSCMT